MNQAQAIATIPAPALASRPRFSPARRRVVPPELLPVPLPAPNPDADPDGLQACMRIWTRVRGLDAAFWLGLPERRPSPAAGHKIVDLAGALGLGPAPYAGIALEAERTLSLGVSGASAPALLLLAAIALDRRQAPNRPSSWRASPAGWPRARTRAAPCWPCMPR